MAAIDYSQDIATLLRTGTADAHDKAEHSKGAGWLVRGELDKDEYVRFLMMLYHVYDALERGLERHAAHPVLAPTYNPTLFARAQSLSSDIAYLLQTPESDWQTHPLHSELIAAPPQPFADYKTQLESLAETDPARLLAHAYVRYLGDLSGGQFIKRRIAKAYGLEDGLGVSFYEFKQLGGAATSVSTIGDMKKIKEWYRNGMNEGAGNDEDLKRSILDEASLAFDLNTGLFTTLRPPSRARTPDLPTPAVLGDPITPPQSPLSTSPAPLATINSSSSTVPAQGAYPLSSVVAFIIALCLSHSVLTVGGFTGATGYTKLEVVFQWLLAPFSSAS